MYKYGIKYIDTIAAMTRIVEMVDRCKITDFKEVIYIDYRGFIVDFNLKVYFEIENF